MAATSAAEFTDAAAEVFAVRPMAAGDIAFVMDSWLRQAWRREEQKLKSEGQGRRRRDKARHPWFVAVRPHVERLLDGGSVVVLVACDRTEPSHIGGWVAVKDGAEYASYVKAAYRPWGIAQLLRAAMEGI